MYGRNVPHEIAETLPAAELKKNVKNLNEKQELKRLEGGHHDDCGKRWSFGRFLFISS